MATPSLWKMEDRFTIYHFPFTIREAAVSERFARFPPAS